MANMTAALRQPGFDRIQQGVRTEVKRLSRHRLHEPGENTMTAIRHLTSAGIISRRFAMLLQRILRITARASSRSRIDLGLATDALAVLRIFPNRTRARHA